MRRGLRGVLLVGAILSVWAGPAYAQAMGSIFGKVMDTSGAVLPGVTVTVSGGALQQPLVGQSTESGAYQFPRVPIGTYTVSFELASFKKATRTNVIVTDGFNAGIDQKLELGQMTEEVTVSAESPVVDLKKTTTGGTFTADILEKIPTARDPWQVINMAPGVQAGLNVGGSSSGQQVGLVSRGTGANVQWNLEGGSITDLSSNSSPAYFNFDSFEQISVTNGGGDVSVQSSGLSINLITKSGSNVFKGTAVTTFENDAMQAQNVTEELFKAGANGFLSGNPLIRINNYSIEYGGPIMKNRLWFWGAADKQDINVGILNFFDATKGAYCQELIAAQKARTLSSAITYDKLQDVQNCLGDDKTVIKDIQWKINYQVNSANKVQWLFQSDNKYRNARGASATTQKEATTQQTSDAPWKLPLPTHSLTHTLIASDKLVFSNMFTYVHGGFFLDYQDVPPQGDCEQSRYLGTDNYQDYLTGSRASADCLWNVQSLSNRTTAVSSRSLGSTYQTNRHRWEAKTDGTYFMSNKLGGDHSLKFGLGWTKAPIMSFSHISGGARTTVQCVGNATAGCGTGDYAAVGSASGIVPYQAVLTRDRLLNNDWHSYSGYIQDGYSTGRWRVNGGLRYDWQTSKWLGGCVPANSLAPDLLPAQCEEATDVDPISGKTLQSFGNWAPRVSVTYDLFGNGKTSARSSFSYYYNTKITLANSLGGLQETASLTWGPNLSSGACSTTAGSGCWTDANQDGLVQRSELTGTPTPSNSRFVNGVLTPAGNTVDPSTRIGRTREAIVGMQHELIPNLAVGADYIYRKYDNGTAGYTRGYEPGAAGFPLSQIYTGPLTYTDPVTGTSAPYYVVCAGCARPTGVGTITLTNPNWQVYHGVDITMNKRYSQNWQAQVGVTLQTNPQNWPKDSPTFVNPTAYELRQGYSTLERYLVKVNGSYTAKWDIMVSGNLNINDGATRIRTINGPGAVYGGTTGTISYGTLRFEPDGTTRLAPVKLLDLGVQKPIRFGNSKYQIKLMFDAFNVFNVNTITNYNSDNTSTAGYSQPFTIVPPRVYRIGARFVF